MDQITYIEQELDSFPNTLTLYREQLKHWFIRLADAGSRANDLPSLMNMERVIKLGHTTTLVSSTDDDFLSSVAQCPNSGILEIESKFESVYDIPVGNIQVDVIAMDGGETTPITLDEHGKGQFEGIADKFYRVHVHSAITSEHVDELFSSYDGLNTELEGWLRKEWEGFKPQWSQQSASASLAATGRGILAGGWAAIVGVWDEIGELSDILKDPNAYLEKLGESAEQLVKLAESAPLMMEKAMLLASDEAALFLLVRTAILWLDAVPTSQLFESSAEATRLADSAPGEVRRANFPGGHGLRKSDGHDHQELHGIRRPLQESGCPRRRCRPEKRPDAVELECAAQHVAKTRPAPRRRSRSSEKPQR
jgi:hypothetical protein